MLEQPLAHKRLWHAAESGPGPIMITGITPQPRIRMRHAMARPFAIDARHND